MPVNLSYINSLGEEVILDSGDNGFMRELRGRTGDEAPSLDLTTIEYADGSNDVIVSKFKTRPLTFYFYALRKNVNDFETALDNLKQKLIETGNKNEWGHLKMRRRDGTYVTINCTYQAGFDQIVRDEDSRITFSLTFLAADPLFYDATETIMTVPRTEEVGLRMANGLTMHDGLYMASSGMVSDITISIKGQRCYPRIVITGYAEMIRLENTTTDRKIQMDSDFILQTGETLTIYTEPKKRKVIHHNLLGQDVNVTPKLTAISTLDWPLERGDNAIHITINQEQESTTCKFYYRQGYLSL